MWPVCMSPHVFSWGLLDILYAHASGCPVQIYLIIYESAPLLNSADTGQCKNVRHTI